jgi:hypothetical protein
MPSFFILPRSIFFPSVLAFFIWSKKWGEPNSKLFQELNVNMSDLDVDVELSFSSLVLE